MIKKLLYTFLILIIAFTLSSCGRNLAANTYTSDSTLNIVLEGRLLAKRDIKITEDERLGDNAIGGLAGAVTGAMAFG
ncbi:hypothetical protein [Candidatus Tisiphia endosymbiont of Dioctria rufipes]|uniref:hypothetical protein n=1 Tax=Candidatus Tisiphia endosymbiont of Dioctria rufipes TaxID=3066255 RepID=UPI00312C9825